MTDAELMLQDCLKRYKKLYDYEQGFIDSLAQMTDFGCLSHYQYETLEQIWDRVTG